MMSNPIGVVVAGAGRIGKMHASIFAKTPGARLAGVVDRRLRRQWLGEYGLADVPVFSSAAEALEKTRAEAVVIAASSTAHIELIREVTAAGRHVLCEKPVAFSSAVITALASEMQGFGGVIQAGFNRRFDPQFARIQAAVQAGELGRMYLYRIINRDPRRPPPGFIPRSGGMLADFHCHDLDMLRFLSGGEIAEVHTYGAQLIADEAMQGDLDAVVISARMRDGALAGIDGLRETNCGYDQRIEAAGEQGCLRADNIPAHFVRRGSEAGDVQANPRADFIARYRESFEGQAQAFLRAIRGECACPVTLADAAAAMRAVEAAQTSLKENRAVAL